MNDPVETLAGLAAVVTLPVGLLAGLFVGWRAAAVVFVVGWLLLVPVLGVLDDVVDSGGADNEEDADDPLERLRERYAAGEIDEAEFERRVERLLETEDADAPDGGRERETEFE